MVLQVYNTLTRRKEEFQPLEPGKVKMYVCGPTVYDSYHLGHARPAIIFDVVRRYLEHLGFQVTYVTNFTDIDDKIIARAREANVPWRTLTEKYISEYFGVMDALNVKRATHYPRCTQFVPQMVEFVGGLLERGFAYAAQGNVLFDLQRYTRDHRYGRLSGRSLEDETVTSGRLGEEAELKRHPADFFLWKAAKAGEPAWDSPWGRGRPGWHLECSVMSGQLLGEKFDIHGGGADLIFPHHEGEIAQSEAYYGRQQVNYWLHNGHIMLGEKMSKSLGNVVWLRETIKPYGPYPPAVVRLLLLGHHYRSQFFYEPGQLADSAAALERLRNAAQNAAGLLAREPAGQGEAEALARTTVAARAKFAAEMDDDFNTAGALGAVFELVAGVNALTGGGAALSVAQQAAVKDALAELRWMLEEILGLPLFETGEKPAAGAAEAALLEMLLELRAEARRERNFALADRIRARLGEAGFKIEDLPGGQQRAKRT